MNTQLLETPFTPLQVELLKVCNRHVSDQQLNEIKDMIGQYFMKNAIELATRIGEEKGFTDETYRSWLDEDNVNKQP